MARSLLACCLLASIACGPSLKQAQRSIERYEQCYSADYDAAVTPDRRHDCWSRWLAECSKDQPLERVGYAEMRLQQLRIDGATKSLPSHPPEPIPMRTHDYERPPPTEHQTSSCDPLCNARWARCNDHCELNAKSCVAACKGEYRVCVDGCP
jgi:hypothetical protein